MAQFINQLCENFVASNEDENTWEVERIVESIQKPDCRYYRVKWVRYVWQTEEMLQPLQNLIDLYWKEHRKEDNDQSRQQYNKSHGLSKNKEIQRLQEMDSSMENQIDSQQDIDHQLQPTTKLSSLQSLHSMITAAPESLLSLPAETNNLQLSAVISTTNLDPSSRIEQSLKSLADSVNDLQTIDRAQYFEQTATHLPPTTVDSASNSREFESTLSIFQRPLTVDNTSKEVLNPHHFQQQQQQLEAQANSDSTQEISEDLIPYEDFTRFNIPSIIGEEKRFKCALCQKMFGRKTSLQRHELIHTGDRPYKCEHCTKTFNQNSTLQRHLLIHKEIKQYKCSMCEKKFVEKIAMKRHSETHKATNPWECPECGKKFRLKEYLSKHTFLHKGLKPHKCEKCEASFADSGTLKRHLMTHTNPDETFECKNCLKRLKNERSLTKHKSTCKTYTCVICRTIFYSKEQMENHKKNGCM